MLTPHAFFGVCRALQRLLLPLLCLLLTPACRGSGRTKRQPRRRPPGFVIEALCRGRRRDGVTWRCDRQRGRWSRSATSPQTKLPLTGARSRAAVLITETMETIVER